MRHFLTRIEIIQNKGNTCYQITLQWFLISTIPYVTYTTLIWFSDLLTWFVISHTYLPKSVYSYTSLYNLLDVTSEHLHISILILMKITKTEVLNNYQFVLDILTKDDSHLDVLVKTRNSYTTIATGFYQTC